ncbi:hypothetical protein RSOLAG1IB_09986 [Rhizoctonia solani AG-1 IB]|uniref:Zn(2)-C6 fungal-type domain-containing protein n=1 Tax=Thanatephorus cucumeris (strain AG1-IB / isolate 7/3/14) TaxID=1108050 RepID=A0A0B7FYQ1_THACB|nr:hypothetical protein RSOLAG1IB_09986 [Rhizoctonia solani AG-1 IB]
MMNYLLTNLVPVFVTVTTGQKHRSKVVPRQHVYLDTTWNLSGISLSTMSQRSMAGCRTCKAKRRKCDETKPSCLRCARSGSECVYEYIQLTGNGKKRTKPANITKHQPKRPGEQSNSTIVSEFIIVSPASAAGTSAREVAQGVVPLLDPPMIWATSSQPTILRQPTVPQYLTPGQAGLFDALFSLADPDHTSNQPAFSSVWGLTNPDPDLDSNHLTSHVTELNSYCTSALAPNSGVQELDDDEDIEGVGAIMCGIPLALDRTVESNSLPFVLQCHAQWIPLMYFDPKIVIYQTKETIISQFSESFNSRFRLILFSELMRTMAKHRILDEGGKRILQLLGGEVRRNVTDYQIQKWPMDEHERKHANRALDHLMNVSVSQLYPPRAQTNWPSRQLVVIQITAAPLASTLHLVRTAAPVFLSACPPPHPPHVASIMLGNSINLKGFVVADVVFGIATGLPLSCRSVSIRLFTDALGGKLSSLIRDRYHVPWSLELCELFAKADDQGAQWVLGIPDQYILLFTFIYGLMEEAKATGGSVDPQIIAQIEDDMPEIVILPCQSTDPSLTFCRMVVQECWREAALIYFYMVLHGAHALDPRVEQAQKKFMKLVNGVSPGRNPDTFLIIPMMIVGLPPLLVDRR